jgi:hypothetical protein
MGLICINMIRISNPRKNKQTFQIGMAGKRGAMLHDSNQVWAEPTRNQGG